MSDIPKLNELDEALRTSRAQTASKRLLEEITQRTEIFVGNDGKVYASLDPNQKHVVIDIEGQEFQDHAYLVADELGLAAARTSCGQNIGLRLLSLRSRI
jgi:hypothetical protein